MHACFFLAVWILDQRQLGIGLELFHLGKLDEIVDSFAIVLEVETGVLEGIGRLDNRLTKVLHLLLRRHHNLHIVAVRQLDANLEQSVVLMIVLMLVVVVVCVSIGTIGTIG